jgi:hypothetical protein
MVHPIKKIKTWLKIRKLKGKEIEYDHIPIWDGAKFKIRRVPKNEEKK